MSAGEYALGRWHIVSGYLILQSWSRQPKLGAFLIKRIPQDRSRISGSLFDLRVSGRVARWRSNLPCRPVAPPRPPGFASRIAPLDLSGHTARVCRLALSALVNGALWTITYEFRCYLLIPLLASLGLYWKRTFFLVAWVAVVLGAGVYSTAHLKDAMSLGLLRFVPFFLAGNCAYLFRDRLGWNRAAGIVTLLTATLSMGSLAATRLVLPVAGSYAILWLALSPWSPLRHLSPSSDISYGVYLYGWPAQKLLLWYFPTLALGVQILLTLSVSLALGWISWHVIEKRCLKWKPTAAA